MKRLHIYEAKFKALGAKPSPANPTWLDLGSGNDYLRAIFYRGDNRLDFYRIGRGGMHWQLALTADLPEAVFSAAFEAAVAEMKPHLAAA